MKEIGAAIIGCGAIHSLHADSIAKLEGVKLVAVIDTDIAKAEQASNIYQCQALRDYRDILDNPDIHVVHLCTPHHLHADMAIDLLQHGKHVLTEKPLADNMQAALAMAEQGNRSTGQLGVMFQNRYNDSSREIIKIINDQSLGKLICMKGSVTWHRNAAYYVDSPWRGRWESEGGGLLINQAIHTLDLLQWFGGEIDSVRGSITNDILHNVIEVEDTAHASIDFVNGTRAIFYGTNGYGVNSPVEMELVFQHGTLHMRRECLYLWQDGQETLLSEPALSASGDKSYWGTGHRLLIEDFYRHIADNKKFWLDGHEGLKALKLVKDIYNSSNFR